MLKSISNQYSEFTKVYPFFRTLESQLLTNLNNILGNKPNLVPNVESIKAFSETKTLVLIYVQEKFASGTNKKIPGKRQFFYLKKKKI